MRLSSLVLGLLTLATAVLGDMKTYIVMFDSTVTEDQVDAAVAALELNGGVIGHRFSRVMHGFSAQIPEDYVAVLSANPLVTVEAEGVVKTMHPAGDARGPAMMMTGSVEVPDERDTRRAHPTPAEERLEAARARRTASHAEVVSEGRHHHGGK